VRLPDDVFFVKTGDDNRNRILPSARVGGRIHRWKEEKR
jgi:hypothetical protein